MSLPKAARLVPQPEGTQPEEVTHISSFGLVMKGRKLLLVRRVRPERWAGRWCLPASVLLYGEDPEEGIRRVARDQLGVEAKGADLLGLQSYGDKHWDLCMIYGVRIGDAVKLGQDFDKADYFDPAGLPPELREDHKEVLDMARSKKII